MTPVAIKAMKVGTKVTDGYFAAGDGRLIVRCRASRGVTVREFCFRWRDGGDDNLLTIGTFPAMALTEARRRVDELRKVRADGGDPRLYLEQQQIERERVDREKQTSGTFKGLLDAYVVGLKANGKVSAREVENCLNRHVIKEFPKLAKRKATDITPHDVVEIIAKMIRAGLTRKANMVRAYLHAAFAVAAKSDLNPRVSAQDRSAFRLESNPVRDVPRQADFDRALDRVLTDAELRGYWLALIERKDPIGAALKCSLLLGGQRLQQLLRATWGDYDRAGGTLHLRDPKGRGGTRDHVLPLSPRIVAQLPLPHPDGGPWIFTTGNKRPIHASTLSPVVAAIAKPLTKGKTTFTARDVRRSVETRLAAMGVTKEHRALTLSHGLKRNVQDIHYDMYKYLPEKAAALALWEKHIDALVAGPPPKKGKAKLRLVA